MPIYGGVGSINNVFNAPLICAGGASDKTTPQLCQIYENRAWQNSSYAMNEGRYSSAYIELEDKAKRLLVVGGSNADAITFDSGEILESQGWTRVNGPTTGGSKQACMVLYNSTVGLLTGGIGKENTNLEAIFFSSFLYQGRKHFKMAQNSHCRHSYVYLFVYWCLPVSNE